MNSVVLQFRTDDPGPRGSPPAALGALSRHLSASALHVSHLTVPSGAPEGAAAEAAAQLAVSLGSREAAQSLAQVLADWSGQHPSSKIVVQLGSSLLEISGETPQSADVLLQRLVAAVPPDVAGAASAPAAPAAARPPVQAVFQLKELPDGPVTPIFGTVIAGRHPESGLRLPAPATQHGGPSRRHAQLSVEGGTLWVEDLGSTNGTFVNSIRVVRKTRLRHGDRLRFDRIEFEVQALPGLEKPQPYIQDIRPLQEPPRPAAAAVPRPGPQPGAAALDAFVNAAVNVIASSGAHSLGGSLATTREPPSQSLPDAAGSDAEPLPFGAVTPLMDLPPLEHKDLPPLEQKSVFVPAERSLGEMTAFVVDGSSGKPLSEVRQVQVARRTELRILDDQGRPIDTQQPLQPRQRYTLQVGIRDGLNSGMGTQDTEGAEWVWVVLTDETDGDAAIDGRLFELDHRYTALRLPASGDSLGPASFRFAALPPPQLHFGRSTLSARIGVRLYHKLNLIDHTQIDLSFAPKEHAREHAREQAWASYPAEGRSAGVRIKSMQLAGRLLEQPAPDAAARALTISISKPEPLATYYRIAMVCANRVHPEQPGLFASQKLPLEELEAFASDFHNLLLKAVFGRSLTDVNLSITEQDALLSQLSALGDGIVTRLFSPGAEDNVLEPGEQLAEGSIIQICLGAGAQDLFLPWQILTVKPATDRSSPGDPRNFWGYRFIIETKRSGDGVDSRPPAARAPSARVTYARGGFENEASHYARLKTIVAESGFPASLIDPVVEAREPFVETLSRGGGELLYVYAPGHSAPATAPRGDNAAQAQVVELGTLLEGTTSHARSDVENLRRVQRQFLQAARPSAGSALSLKQSDVELSALPSRMDRKGLRLSDAPIVFLNTCEGAQVWNALSSSFPAFFLDYGARAVLATQSTVPMVTADVFGMAVLERLFQGDTLGKAVLAGRWKLIQEHRNPLGLCYGLYGAADARLVTSGGGSGPPGEDSSITPALTFTAGPMAGGRYVLRLAGPPGEARQWALGSDSNQDVVITGEGVSRQHAVIVHEEGRRFRIKDRLSRNGTYVNGRRVESHILSPGTEVRLGTVTFVFELLDRSGRKWGAPVSKASQRRTRAPIDTVLLLVGSLVAAAVLFFVLSFLRSL